MKDNGKPKIAYYHDQKDRKFVREVSGEYNLTKELERLRSLPRVRRGRDVAFQDGPQTFSKHYLEPKDGLGQTLHIHLEEYAPGAKSQKHGHVNEAVFYILDGEGAEVHDGVRYEWEAGDVAKRFVEAFMQAAAYTDTHRAETVELLAGFSKLKPSTVRGMVRSTVGKSVAASDIEPVIAAAVKYGVVAKTFPAAELIAPIAPRT